jgi:pimeloyl-ACP methyl ester carboxylesterase
VIYQHNAQHLQRNSIVKMLICVLFVILISSCNGSDNGSPPESTASEGNLVSWTAHSSPFKENIVAAIALEVLQIANLTYDVSCYSLVYKTTDVNGALIDASGLLCLPKGKSGAGPLLSFQHGTIFNKTDAPTTLNSSYYWTGPLFASLGYIAVVPDYLGYGASSAILHPYLHAKTLSSSIVDMLRAAKHFLALPEINIATDGRLFLAGYSEGGYATLAAQKSLEGLPTEFTVTISEPGAGPYDVSETFSSQVKLPTVDGPAYITFLVKSYDMIYIHPSKITYYFTQSAAAQLDTLFAGNLSSGAINGALGGSTIPINTLFNQTFLDSFNGPGEADLKAALVANDIYNWKPSAPTIFFHGQDDDLVPYANSAKAVQTMQANGAASVSLHDCNAGPFPTTHENCGAPYLVDLLQTFGPIAGSL